MNQTLDFRPVITVQGCIHKMGTYCDSTSGSITNKLGGPQFTDKDTTIVWNDTTRIHDFAFSRKELIRDKVKNKNPQMNL